MDITRGNIDDLFRVYNASFQEGLTAENPDLMELTESLAYVLPIATGMARFPFLQVLQGWREWIGDRNFGNVKATTFDVLVREFEKSVAIKRTEIEDDQYGIYSPLVAEAGDGFDELMVDLITDVLVNNPTCCTGKAFFANDHQYGKYVLDNLRTEAFSVTAYEDALKTAATWQRADGRLARPRFTDFYCGEALRSTAFSVFGREKVVVSGAAVANEHYGKVVTDVRPEITGNQWYLVDRRKRIKPIVVAVRKNPELLTNDVADIKESGMMKLMTDGRVEAAPGLPNLAIGRVAA